MSARARASRPYRCLASCCVRSRRLLLLLLLCVILSRIPSPRPDKCIGPDAIVTMLVCVSCVVVDRTCRALSGEERRSDQVKTEKSTGGREPVGT